MWNDNETTEDLIGFKIHADLICSVITNKNMLPVTIGLFGDWGSGKTSVMKMVEEALDCESYEKSSKEYKQLKKTEVIYFDSWTFEGYDDSKAAILNAVLLKLAENKLFQEKIKDKGKDLLKSINWMRISSLIYKFGAPLLLAQLNGGDPGMLSMGSMPFVAGESWSDKPKEEISFDELLKQNENIAGLQSIQNFRNKFKEMLDETGIETLVIVIDDLDRCSPERIIDNLEAIKLFLNVDNTAFIIGADPRIIRHAVERRYGMQNIVQNAETNKQIVNDYIEKLIQVPYTLPRLSPSEAESYTSLLFCKNHLDDKNFGKCLDAFYATKKADLTSSFGYGDIKEIEGITVVGEFENDLKISTQITPLLSEGLKGNPRQLKRFLNAFILRLQLAKMAGFKDVKNDVLAKLMVLEYIEPDKFMILHEKQASGKEASKIIKELEGLMVEGKIDKESIKKKYEEWATENICIWLGLEPKLADVNLSEYLWLTRDKLQDSLIGLSLISPKVRTMLNNLLSGKDAQIKKSIQDVKDSFLDKEVGQLLEQLKMAIIADLKKYKIITYMIEDKITGAIECLISVIGSVNANNLPAGLGPALLKLQKDGEINGKVTGIIEDLKNSGTPISKTLNR